MGQARSRSPSRLSRTGDGDDNTSENSMDVDATLMFPFLQDDDAVLYVKCSKVIIILRGLPGSGKSYIARRIKQKFGQNCVVCSIDDYFKQGTHYRFEPTKLHEAEEFCQQVATEACYGGKHVVVIDNTNECLKEMNCYMRLSHETNYVMLVEEPRTAWKFDADILSEKNKHNMNEDELNERLDQWEEILPVYFGWFLNAGDSLALVKIAEAYMDECNNVPEFLQQFKELMSFDGHTGNDLREYFNLPDHDHTFHCTTRFCVHHNNEKDDYMMRESVQKNYGTRTSLSVIGFVVTPQTFLARVKLSSEQLQVWGQDDYESPSIQEATDVARSTNVLMRPTAHKTQNIPVCITTLRPYANHERRTAQCFQPTDGLGRRAHITLGCAKGVQPVQAGFDLMEVIEHEKVSARTKVPTFDIGCAKVRRYGEAMWVIYPNKLYVIDALFAFYMSAPK